MFDPIQASIDIKESFIDYITTSFSMSDAVYAKALKRELEVEGAVAKGPYLDIGGSYETGKSLQALIQEGTASALFEKLEAVNEKDKVLQLERPLYLHQEKAISKAGNGNNLIVTTGTGSGKTECFLIPIVDALLREIESGALNNGVRALIIYPMNALANDQMKRMRALFASFPQIKFGVYNGNTKHERGDALQEYRSTYRDANGAPMDPVSNEILSREEMQEKPPHILITNYSMLEYMLLRPKDDQVFSGSQLRFIVLDEAHIYKGATGMETSLLMSRLRARINAPEHIQYILTSATLGSKDANDEIIGFANRLCGVPFYTESIIRSTEKHISMKDLSSFPIEMFTDLANPEKNIETVLNEYNANFAPDADDEEKLYELCLHSLLFEELRKIAYQPMTIWELQKELSKTEPIDFSQIRDFINVCSRATKGNSSLIKARYHYFVRALEGAYATLGATRNLFLSRRQYCEIQGQRQMVFEIAVCTDCGRVAVVGRLEGGKLIQHARGGEYDDQVEYYLIKESDDGELFDEDDDLDELSGLSENDFVLCTECGALTSAADAKFELPCEHGHERYVRVYRSRKTDNTRPKCSACGYGNYRRFYLGSDAATAVLGTELFELLPQEETIRVEQGEATPSANIFTRKVPSQIRRVEKTRQFLCFSDSRSEAAFFATYMDKSYAEFLRRRGIWQVAERLFDRGRSCVSVREFEDELERLFVENGTFVEWDKPEESRFHKSNAWVALLNELYNARRRTSLVSMGIIAFEYKPNRDVVQNFAEQYNIEKSEAASLLELLVLDGVYSGAVDVGNEYTLQDVEREYIFYYPHKKKLKKMLDSNDSGKSYLSGWCGRKRPNGNYYANAKISRLVRALAISADQANELLEQYWSFLTEERNEYIFDICDFDIKIGSAVEVTFYRCNKCGRVTPNNYRGQCASVKCDGILVPFDPATEMDNNHYAKLYKTKQMKPMFIKEHTAQLSKKRQKDYQQAFVEKRLNALSCSTTFEMGVDVGSLETVFMRDVPPSPSNYVQRAGRAGRSLHSAAFVLTYAKLSSHDFTYYNQPKSMISGSIRAPIFEIENEKVICRHIFAVALSKFFSLNPDIYAGDNLSPLLNEGGYERLKEYLAQKPQDLHTLLEKSIPQELHSRLGISDGSWFERLCGDDGVLETAVLDFHQTVKEMEKEIAVCTRAKDYEAAGKWQQTLKRFRCAKEDNVGKKSLIDYLVRNNVLPKYGFPVDTVELLPDVTSVGNEGTLQLNRDLQIAIAEYAPGSEVVADGRLYTSRYIRKIPGKSGHTGWEEGNYCEKCPDCGQPNFTKEPIMASGRECVSCHNIIRKPYWRKTLEPRRGFLAEAGYKDVPLRRPERDYKMDDYYIGDPLSNLIEKRIFMVNGQKIILESTTNDSLVVVGRTEYRVCTTCGYANESPFPQNHKNAYGYVCKNTEGRYKQYNLSHDFKTDVAKITFCLPQASSLPVMLSVLYALLEGLSQEMGIERTDIKGCLHRVNVDNQLLFSVVLYDAVAGGAGHVRRIVSNSGKSFQHVLAKALDITGKCNCDLSCYNCLRNYYNQKIHDDLNRSLAYDFLQNWQGNMELIIEPAQTEVVDTDSEEIVIQYDDEDNQMNDYLSWLELGKANGMEETIGTWDTAQIPYTGKFLPVLMVGGTKIEPLVIWEEPKVMIFYDIDIYDVTVLTEAGWKCFDVTEAPQNIKMVL